jgi:predicted metalloprotease
MRWRDLRRSDNVEDRRSAGSGFGGLKLGGWGLLAVVVISLLLGKNPLNVLNLIQGEQLAPTQTSSSPAAAHDEASDFVSAILGSTEDTWTAVFHQMGGQYERPRLVLFRGAVNSACGYASAAVGPFYCSGDRQVYLDLGFFQELHTRFGAPGDFAQAYVIAREIGHHVQNLLGISEQVARKRARVSETAGNALSVRQELQADCFAGVWGHYAAKNNLLDPGDVEEGLKAAEAIGDDRLQQQARGYVTPESFTHGSSAQRVRWFRTGLESGDLKQCDTFSAARL